MKSLWVLLLAPTLTVALQEFLGSERSREEFFPLDQMFGRPEKPMYSENQRLFPDDTLSLYQSLHYTTRILARHNITYWAGAGTLLGAVRNSGLIPHDNDVDLHIHQNDVEKLKSQEFKDDLGINGLKLILKYTGLWGITNTTLKPTPFNNNPLHVPLNDQIVHSPEGAYPYFVDIFSMRESKDNSSLQYVNDNPELRPRVFPANVTSHLVLHRFGSTKVFIPTADITNSYLNTTYGADWNATVNCAGTLHGCKLDANKEWALRHHALPDGPLAEPSFVKLGLL